MNKCVDCQGEGCIDISAEQDGSVLDGCIPCDGRGGFDLLTICGTFNTNDCTSAEDLCKLLKTEKGEKE